MKAHIMAALAVLLSIIAITSQADASVVMNGNGNTMSRHVSTVLISAKRHHRRHHRVRRHYRRHHARHGGGSISLAGVTPVLANKAREIASSCGSTVVSAVRPWGKTSNHRLGLAVDMNGNPGCIYAHLRGWPGGYSTDYGAVRHVHISYSHAHEWGLRFAHGRSDRARFAGNRGHIHLSARSRMHVAARDR